LETQIDRRNNSFDKTNALIGFLIFLFTFIVYRMTVAPTLSFWDCGEFIACSYILGVPHPPGTPLFVLLGRVFSVLPIAGDICLKINLMSVISSAGTALFGYLAVVRIISFWYRDGDFTGWKRIIAYIGGIVGSLFMAFSTTNWGNSVEAEVYGLSMCIMTAIIWMSLKYFESRERSRQKRIIVAVSYLAMLGVGIHLTTFLVMPIVAVYFILKKDAPPKAWIAICSFFALELLFILVLSGGVGGYNAFIGITVIMLGVLAFMVYKYINWPILIAIGAFSMIMIGFWPFVYGMVLGAVALIIYGLAVRDADWRTGLVILMVAFIGFSVHAFIPIRSAENPRIDENNASRSFNTFVSFLDRKQYIKVSMVERMFSRRAELSSQFGRHAHMGFWSYFEKEYGITRFFGVFFVLGLFGVYFAIMRKIEIGLPFLILLLLASVGLILYMNFADGIMYNDRTGDAYLEVRDRSYFFTPAYIYFGLAIGLGVAAVMETFREMLSVKSKVKFKKPIMSLCSLMVLLPGFALANNYFENNHSSDYFPYIYSHNILNNCGDDAILFTSGDNDTFPLWCVQEVYEMRKDVRVVNLSLFNTDWYVFQMKHFYDVPITLTDEQILWYPFEYQGQQLERPKEWFYDRARKRRTYLMPMPHDGRIVKLQDMMVDEVVLNNNFEVPVCFTSEPYAESPLSLREKSVSIGTVYELAKEPPERRINAEKGFKMMTEVYKWDGLNDLTIPRNENTTGVMMTFGFNALRIAEEFRRTDQMDKAKEMLTFIIDKYPEFYQSYMTLASYYEMEGDTVTADNLLAQLEDVMTTLHENNPDNIFYIQDLGLAKYYNGKTDEALAYLWKAFEINASNGYGYQKLMRVLYDLQRSSEMIRATQMHANYKRNLQDPMVQQLLGATRGAPPEMVP